MISVNKIVGSFSRGSLDSTLSIFSDLSGVTSSSGISSFLCFDLIFGGGCFFVFTRDFLGGFGRFNFGFGF